MNISRPALPVIPGASTLHATRNRQILVDADLWPALSRQPWSISYDRKSGREYPVARLGGRVVRLHRLLADAPPGTLIDHRDNDTFNAMLSNLRPATRGQNAANAAKRAGASPYKGVVRAGNHWRARIAHEGRRIDLGTYDTEAEAAWAYAAAARRLFASYARPSEIPPDVAPTPARRISIVRDLERRLAQGSGAWGRLAPEVPGRVERIPPEDSIGRTAT